MIDKGKTATPFFAVIGAMKAGTSAFYYTLRDVPEISLTRAKEPHYFIHSHEEKRFEQYSDSFLGDGMRGDVSPNYARIHHYPEVPRRMYEHNPGMKLIYILRDPIDRIVSHLWHNLLNDRLSRDEVDEAAISENYVMMSAYHYQLSGFTEYYPKDQFHLISFDELVQQPHAVFSGLFTFLGLDRDVAPDRLIEAYRSKNRYKKLYASRLKPVLSNMGLWTPYKYLCYFLDVKVPKPTLKEHTRRKLSGLLFDDVRSLESDFGFDTSSWKVNRQQTE